MQENGDENDGAEPSRNQKAGGDRHPIEKGVYAEAKQDGAAGVAAFERFVMGLFAKVKVRGDGVLEQMDQKKADEQVEKGVLSRKTYRLRQNFDQHHRQHVAGTKSEEILKILARPFPAHHKIAAEEIAGRCDKA